MRISVTGFTPAHQGTKSSNRKGIIQIPQLLQDILVDAGHEVGYNLPNPDLTIVYIFTLGSINSSFAVECLDIIREAKGKVLLSFDDWRIIPTYQNYERVLRQKRFSKSHPSISAEGVMRNLDVLQDIVDGKYHYLIPAHKNGDHSLLGVRGEFTVFDPSVYVLRPSNLTQERQDLIPVHASLAADHKWLDKRKYSYIQCQYEKEVAVFHYYERHGIVMSPPYYHNGSGWWRNRYTLANMAHAIVIEDYGSVFGEAYELERSDVNELTFEKLYEKQDFMYNKNVMSKDEAIMAVQSALNTLA